MPQRRWIGSARVGLILLCCPVMLTGCRGAKAIGATSTPASGPARETRDEKDARVRRDPVAYFRDVRRRCGKLAQYTCTLIRQERRGLIPTLQPQEEILCWFRREPFSIRMYWTDPNGRFGESTYVETWSRKTLRYVPRKGLLGLPPSITTVDVMLPVLWGETKFPVTDFGPENLIVQTLQSIDEAGTLRSIAFNGTTSLADYGRTVYDFRVLYDPAKKQAPIQDLYIDPETDVAVGTLLRLPDEQLDAAYFYLELDCAVTLSDDDFLLDADRAAGTTPQDLVAQGAASQASSAPAGATP